MTEWTFVPDPLQPWHVLDGDGVFIGQRRTRDDAYAMLKRLQRTIPWRGPFSIQGPPAEA